LAPAPPPDQATTAAASTWIGLAWTDNATTAPGFSIQRSPDGTNFNQIATVGTRITNYIDTGVAPVTTYYYRVSAYNGSGSSANSSTASATTPVGLAPLAPSNLAATATTATSISLSWT